MIITRERFNELGLGLDKESCLSCEDCIEKCGKFYCELMPEITIDKAISLDYNAPCLDEERIRFEMTEEEYDAYRHGRLEIERI